jgi:hypothetical protein
VAAAIAVAAPVAVRRQWPVGVFAVVLAANSFLAAAGVSGNPGVLVALALYTVAVTQPASRSVPLAIAAVVLSAAAEWASEVVGRPAPSWTVTLDLLAATVALMLAAWGLVRPGVGSSGTRHGPRSRLPAGPSRTSSCGWPASFTM